MWINAKAELPEKEGWYFVCSNDMGTPTSLGISYWDAILDKWLDVEGDEDTGIDYWMPVPPIVD
jgi:hypothetical protein